MNHHRHHCNQQMQCNICTSIQQMNEALWMRINVCMCIPKRILFHLHHSENVVHSHTTLAFATQLQPYYHIRSHRENNSCKEEKKGKHLPFYHHHVVFFSFYLFIHSIHFMMMMIMIIHESVTIYIQLHF